MQETKQVFLRFHPVSSLTQQTMFSNTAKTVEKAAKVRNKKNRLPQNRPSAMWLNTLGRVMKIRAGPLFTSTP